MWRCRWTWTVGECRVERRQGVAGSVGRVGGTYTARWDRHLRKNRAEVTVGGHRTLSRAELVPQPQVTVDPGFPQKARGHPALVGSPNSCLCSPLTSPWYGFGLRRPADLGHNEGVFALTAGEHDVVAGVAQVGVGLARVALSPHTESQATAVTALLERNTASLPTARPLRAHLLSPWTTSLRDSLRAPRMQPGARLREGLVTGNEFIFVLFSSGPCHRHPGL